jgi:hypothetical protein
VIAVKNSRPLGWRPYFLFTLFPRVLARADFGRSLMLSLAIVAAGGTDVILISLEVLSVLYVYGRTNRALRPN